MQIDGWKFEPVFFVCYLIIIGIAVSSLGAVNNNINSKKQHDYVCEVIPDGE